MRLMIYYLLFTGIDLQSLIYNLTNGIRLAKPEYCPLSIIEMLQKCIVINQYNSSLPPPRRGSAFLTRDALSLKYFLGIQRTSIVTLARCASASADLSRNSFNRAVASASSSCWALHLNFASSLRRLPLEFHVCTMHQIS